MMCCDSYECIGTREPNQEVSCLIDVVNMMKETSVTVLDSIQVRRWVCALIRNQGEPLC